MFGLQFKGVKEAVTESYGINIIVVDRAERIDSSR